MTNRQAIGYMLLACKKANLEKETVRKLFQEMYWEFDLKTVEEAQENGFEWYHSLDEDS
ncbi:hypothetical protein [Alkalihalobacillus deserti]|uniref:hypothetical protein n=1 Tax=Alkalihalobacillus deserti TaxID=2879466 RepID=UPI001D146E2D|nr:hypothetical protein [Alkalihalobacillus deserti]